MSQHNNYHYVSDDDDEDDNAWPYCQNSHVNLELLTNKTSKKFEINKRKLDLIKTSKLLNPLSHRDSEAGLLRCLCDTQQFDNKVKYSNAAGLPVRNFGPGITAQKRRLRSYLFRKTDNWQFYMSKYMYCFHTNWLCTVVSSRFFMFSPSHPLISAIICNRGKCHYC